MEWIVDGEWVQGIADPNELWHPIAQVVQSIADRYGKCGCIGVEGYWREPPKALRAVQLYQGIVSACQRRKAERMNHE